MEALTYVRTPATREFLENFLIRKRPSSDAVDHVLLRKAAMALGWQAGPRSVDAVAALLDHPDPEVRLDAVVALGLTRARSAEKPLRDRLAAEPDAAVRAQIESQLTRAGRADRSGKRARLTLTTALRERRRSGRRRAARRRGPRPASDSSGLARSIAGGACAGDRRACRPRRAPTAIAIRIPCSVWRVYLTTRSICPPKYQAE